MALLVHARREHRHVAAHLRMGERDVHHIPASAALAVRHDVRPSAHVREEVAVPGGAAAHVGRARRDGVQLLLSRLQQLRVWEGVVEVEIRVRLERHRNRQVVVVQQTQGLIAPRVRELTRRSPRDEEQAARAELEAVLRHAVRPHRGDALSAQRVDDLVQRELHRRDRAAARYLRDAGLRHALHAHELDERRVALALLPRPYRHRAQVLNEVAAVDRHALRLHPRVVQVPVVPAAASGDLVLDVRNLCHEWFPPVFWLAVRGLRLSALLGRRPPVQACKRRIADSKSIVRRRQPRGGVHSTPTGTRRSLLWPRSSAA